MRVRDRLHLPCDRRQRGLREPLPARHRPGAAADRALSGRDRDSRGRRRAVPRRHWQGQRPGPLRTRLRRAGAPGRGLCAVEGRRVPAALPGPHRSSELRRGAGHPDRGLVREALQHGREPDAQELRGRPAGRPDADADRRHVLAHRFTARRTGRTHRHRGRVQGRASGAGCATAPPASSTRIPWPCSST